MPAIVRYMICVCYGRWLCSRNDELILIVAIAELMLHGVVLTKLKIYRIFYERETISTWAPGFAYM